jgi:hypothetical protein
MKLADMKLVPLILLALTASAPPPVDLTAAATCTLPRADTEAAFRALTLLGTEDDTEADERGTIYSFGGATLWDKPARAIRFSDYANPNAGEFSQRYEAAADGDYAAARDQMFAAHAKTKCDRESGTSCEIILPPDAGWRRTVTLTGSGGEVSLICDFSKSG